MGDDSPDRQALDGAAFDRVIGTPIRQAAADGRPVRAYGELVALLWDTGSSTPRPSSRRCGIS